MVNDTTGSRAEFLLDDLQEYTKVTADAGVNPE
jgi:hypothetical protein